MTYQWVEVTVKLIGEDYKENVEVYNQKVKYDYFNNTGGMMLADIVCAVNGLPAPKYKPEDIR